MAIRLVLKSGPDAVAGLVAGFCGVMAISWHQARPGVNSGSKGFLALLSILLAALVIAGSGVLVQRVLRHLSPFELTLFQLVVSIPATSALALAFEAHSQAASLGSLARPQIALAVIWTGVFGAGIANLFYYRLLLDWGITRAILITYAIPVVGVVLGLAVGEPIDILLLVGTGLILGGIALVNTGSPRVHRKAAQGHY